MAPTAREDLEAIATSLQLTDRFPDAVERETQALLAAPGVDDAALADATDTPFVTVDGANSKDLDQALHVARTPTGYLVSYAIADASYFVRPGSALFAEALRRGASYYLPGFSVPMLPRALSEGVVSLNPNEDRRALVFRHHLDADAELVRTDLERARIRSRAKLAFHDVQQLVDAPETSPLRGQPFEASLFLLREVGVKRMQLAARRGVVRYRREEVHIDVDGEGLRFAVMEVVRDEVELWNEQLSLLCNAEGGRLLQEHPHPAVQPIYRVQGGPDPTRLEALARLTERFVAVHQLPAAPWRWQPGQVALSEYLRNLPQGPAGTRDDRFARALTRQAMMVNLRADYATEPGPHAGVGAEPYARFSAPMREMVGVFLHKEAVEMLTGTHPPVEADEALRVQVVQAANRARSVQRRVQDLANEVVLDRLFAAELERPRQQRTQWTGTVMGLTSSKVHVRLDRPPMDVKLYLRDVGSALGGARLDVAEEGVVLRQRSTGAPVFRLGEAVTLIVTGRDAVNRRWLFSWAAMAQ